MNRVLRPATTTRTAAGHRLDKLMRLNQRRGLPPLAALAAAKRQLNDEWRRDQDYAEVMGPLAARERFLRRMAVHPRKFQHMYGGDCE